MPKFDENFEQLWRSEAKFVTILKHLWLFPRFISTFKYGII